MFARLIQLCSAFLFAFALLASSQALAGNDGIITVRSAFPIGETNIVALRRSSNSHDQYLGVAISSAIRSPR
jgi:hypothetical protein